MFSARRRHCTSCVWLRGKAAKPTYTIQPKNAVERDAYIVSPQPQPFSRGEKGANPLALWERDGVRAKHSPVLLYDQFVALNCSFRIDQSSLKSVSGMAVPQEQESLELPGYEARFPASGYFR